MASSPAKVSATGAPQRTGPPSGGAVGRPELATDPRFATREARIAHRKELGAVLESVFATRTVAEWMEVLERADVLCAPINDYPALVRDPQVLATGMIVIHQSYAPGTAPAPPLDPLPLAIHLLSVELLFLWLPFGKLAHAFLVFAARGVTGAALARKGAPL